MWAERANREDSSVTLCDCCQPSAGHFIPICPGPLFQVHCKMLFLGKSVNRNHFLTEARSTFVRCHDMSSMFGAFQTNFSKFGKAQSYQNQNLAVGQGPSVCLQADSCGVQENRPIRGLCDSR